MAVWKPHQKTKKKKKASKNIAAPIAIIAFIVIAAVLVFTTQPQTNPLPVLTVGTSEQPGAVGFHEIYVSSDKPLSTIVVLVDAKPATLKSQEGNNHTFEFFASPYDVIGVKPIIVTAIDTIGRNVVSEGQGFYIGYDAIGDKILDVTYYTYERGGYPPKDLVQKIIFEDNQTLNMFYEVVAEGGYNTQSINAIIPLIQNLSYITTSQNKPFNQYVVIVEGRNWIDCQNNLTESIPLEECQRILDEEHSVIMRYPYYPSAQVFVTNTTVDLQPTPGTQKFVVDSMIRITDEVFAFVAQTTKDNNTTENEISL